MSQLRLTPEGPPLQDHEATVIDDQAGPVSEATLHAQELDRAADEGMVEAPGPDLDEAGVELPGTVTDVPGPEDEPRGPGLDVPGTRVPGIELPDPQHPGYPGHDLPEGEGPPVAPPDMYAGGWLQRVPDAA